jgi:hypothetical protein
VVALGLDRVLLGEFGEGVVDDGVLAEVCVARGHRQHDAAPDRHQLGHPLGVLSLQDRHRVAPAGSRRELGMALRRRHLARVPSGSRSRLRVSHHDISSRPS